mgnify:FL=1|jgi:tetratricopeptide (TPR) repeat protein
MKYLANQQIVAALFLSLTVGCSTLQSMPARMKSMVSRAPDSNDPLANVKANVSDDFKMAKRELKSADETLLKYAQMREDMGNHDVALDRYRELLADNPDNVGARLGIARIEYKNGRVHEAEEILKAAARRHPENQQVWIDMGQIQSERKEYGAAIQSLQKAVSIDSSSQAARFELGLAMARGDRLEEAKSHLGFAVGEAAALYNIGFVLSEAGRKQEALHWFEQTLDAFPNAQTRKSATEMIASLGHDDSRSHAGQVASNRGIPSKVDLQQTSFEEWKETPGADGMLSKTIVNVAGASKMNNAAYVPQAAPQPAPFQQRQPAIQRVSHAPRNEANAPQWNRQPVPSPVSAMPAAPGSALVDRRPVTAAAGYPPQWQR